MSKKTAPKQHKKHDLSKAIPWIAGIGLLTTIQLIVVYYTANFLPNAAPSFCTINSTIDCDAVARTNFALFFGVPNAIWGFLFYAFVLFLYFAKSLKNVKIFKFMEVFTHPKSYIFLLTLLVFIADVILGYISTFAIKTICILCFFTYFLNLLLLIVAKPSKSFVDMIITSIDDFMKAISNRVYAVCFFLVVICGISALIYFDNSKVFAPPENSVFSKEFTEFEPTETGNVLGDENAKVIINEFTDIQCPFCARSNTMMNKVADAYDNVKIIHHNLPLDQECNPIPHQMHVNSCLYARYALAAEKQGKSWGLINKMFKNNSELTEEKVLDFAKELKLDVNRLKKDANSKEIKEKLKFEVEMAKNMEINATPTYSINGKKYEGIFRNPADLIKILTDNGATPKRK